VARSARVDQPAPGGESPDLAGRGDRAPEGADPNALTDRQQSILDWIVGFVAENGFAPTIREIGDAFGIAATNGVKCHLTALQKKGRLTWIEGKARTLRVVE
jgi:hypothetical protein